MTKEYCYNCDDFVEFQVREEEQSFDIKGMNIKVIGKTAYCKHCDEKVYIKEFENETIKQANEIYRNKKNIITISEIEFLLKKYQIGKKPLSKLLGWGENTISRYLDGLTPNIEYSNKLKELFDPQKMQSLLLKNKDNITDIAFKKVKINLPEKDQVDKVLQIADCFVEKSKENITPLKLQKLMYYFHAWSLVFFKPIIDEKFEAWVHGPVLPTLYFYYKDYGAENIKYSGLCNTFSEDENVANLVDSVYLAYGKYTAIFIKELTHIEDPWKVSRENLDQNERTNNIIENDIIKKYYLEEKDKYKIETIHDLNNYLNRKVFENNLKM